MTLDLGQKRRMERRRHAAHLPRPRARSSCCGCPCSRSSPPSCSAHRLPCTPRADGGRTLRHRVRPRRRGAPGLPSADLGCCRHHARHTLAGLAGVMLSRPVPDSLPRRRNFGVCRLPVVRLRLHHRRRRRLRRHGTVAGATLGAMLLLTVDGLPSSASRLSGGARWWARSIIGAIALDRVYVEGPLAAPGRRNETRAGRRGRSYPDGARADQEPPGAGPFLPRGCVPAVRPHRPAIVAAHAAHPRDADHPDPRRRLERSPPRHCRA